MKLTLRTLADSPFDVTMFGHHTYIHSCKTVGTSHTGVTFMKFGQYSISTWGRGNDPRAP